MSSYSPQVLLDGADINAVKAVVKVSKMMMVISYKSGRLSRWKTNEQHVYDHNTCSLPDLLPAGAAYCDNVSQNIYSSQTSTNRKSPATSEFTDDQHSVQYDDEQVEG